MIRVKVKRPWNKFHKGQLKERKKTFLLVHYFIPFLLLWYKKASKKNSSHARKTKPRLRIVLVLLFFYSYFLCIFLTFCLFAWVLFFLLPSSFINDRLRCSTWPWGGLRPLSTNQQPSGGRCRCSRPSGGENMCIGQYICSFLCMYVHI